MNALTNPTDNVIQVQAQGESMTPMQLLGRALEKGADIGVLEKLMDLQERHEKNQARRAFDAAMADFRAKDLTITKNRKVEYPSKSGDATRKTHYQHEDLAAIAEVVNPALAECGLSYRFRTSSNPNEPISVTCIVSHRLGYFEENTLCAGRDDSGSKNSIQQIGSTITYLQRYTLKAALGLASAHDDDGAKYGDDGALVSVEQRDQLLLELEKAGGDVAKFCEYLQVEAIAALPASRFPAAMKAVAAKAKKGGAK
jgi:hypothetical protein